MRQPSKFEQWKASKMPPAQPLEVDVCVPQPRPRSERPANGKAKAVPNNLIKPCMEVFTFDSTDWNKIPSPPKPEPEPVAAPAAEEGIFAAASRQCGPPAEDAAPLACRGLSFDYQGSASLLDSLLEQGLPGLSVVDVRRLAQTSKAQKKAFDDNEVWRLLCRALALECGLYAPGACEHWRALFFDTLWPARNKWKGEASTEAVGFRIRVAVRVRPRKHDGGRADGLVLPLHQRLRMLKKGEKLGAFEAEQAGATQEQLAEALKGQGDLSPELLQALLEAQQLGAVMGEVGAQAAGGPKHRAIEVDADAGEADHVASALAEAASTVAPLTKADKEYIDQAEAEAKAAKKEGKEDKENEDEGATSASKQGGAKLLLVQPSRIVMFVPGCGIRPFLFSNVCSGDVSQTAVYQRVAQDAVVSSMNGMNACVLAYGQTGSGKTHTVFGPPGVIEDAHAAAEAAQRRDRRGWSDSGFGGASILPESAGIVLRACDELLSCVNAPGAACTSLSLSAQYVQIYEESLTDLLSGGPVVLREVGEYADASSVGATILQGAMHVQLETLTDAIALLRAGELHKRVAATAMNQTSSRAHTVFLITLTQRGAVLGEDADGGERLISSQLALVDLAGCEQVKQSKVVGQRLREAVGINSSLLVLGKCITALSEGRRHVPYHEAKLTKLLRGAFGGSSRTTCVIAASPDDAHAENTVQALRFGERCATITNSARVAAVSAVEALKVVDEALAACVASMAALEARERTNLPAYGSLKARHASLSMRRQQLGGGAQAA
jgi:kinesin family protein 5